MYCCCSYYWSLPDCSSTTVATILCKSPLQPLKKLLTSPDTRVKMSAWEGLKPKILTQIRRISCLKTWDICERRMNPVFTSDLIIIIYWLQQSFICGQCPFLFPRPFQDGSNIFKWWMQYIKDLSNIFRKNPIYSAAGRKKWRIIFDSGSRHVSPCG